MVTKLEDDKQEAIEPVVVEEEASKQEAVEQEVVEEEASKLEVIVEVVDRQVVATEVVGSHQSHLPIS